jgi:hypothetical protein
MLSGLGLALNERRLVVPNWEKLGQIGKQFPIKTLILANLSGF